MVSILSDPYKNFPEEIYRTLNGYTSTGKNYRTSSTASVYLFERKNSPGLFLKINSIEKIFPALELYSEKKALVWLSGKLNVPQVLCYHKKDTNEYLLTKQLPGKSAEHDFFKNNIPCLIQLLAQALLQIHQIPAHNCPIDVRVETQLQEADERLQKGTLNLEYLPQEWRNRPQQLICHLRKIRPSNEDLVFTHGDYCLPNILLQNYKVTGIIDWGYSGVGDRYRDFISVLYSIQRNLGKKWIPLFFEIYGIDRLDPKKKAFYRLLQDLQS